MPRKRLFITIGVVLLIAIVVWAVTARSGDLVLTGIVTTDDVVISPLVGGQVEKMLVKEGDSVAPHEVLARLVPSELQADTAYYAHSAAEGAVRVQEGEASVRLQSDADRRPDLAGRSRSSRAPWRSRPRPPRICPIAKTMLDRYEVLARAGAVAQQDLDQQTDVLFRRQGPRRCRRQAGRRPARRARAGPGGRRAGRDQAQRVGAPSSSSARPRRRSRTKADVRLAYTEIRAPIAGIVDVAAARTGEVVNAGQPIVTLINPDSLWVRVDVEERYIDASGSATRSRCACRPGRNARAPCFFAVSDAGFATQRDVSRTKRDIKTFEIRLRVDNTTGGSPSG